MGLMPIAAAIDFGGVLWWTQFAFAALTLPLAFGALVQVLVFRGSQKLGILWPLAPIGGFILYTVVQAIPLPVAITALIAPASHSAYQDYAGAILPATGISPPTMHPISVESETTLHVASLLTASMALFWAATQIIVTRRRVVSLLTIIAISGVFLSAVGLGKMLLPEFELLGYGGNSQTFANFVNRNNAALFLNYTAAVSLGLLAWRLATVSGHEFDEDDFELNDMFSLIGESESMVAALGLLASIAGLLICGSRGGLVAMIAGLLLGFGWIHRRRGRRQVLVVAVAFVTGLILLLAPLQINLRSLNRFEGFVSADFSTLTLDGRWTHWKDGLSAAWGYFPLGSGAGTYGTAHLPYLEHGGSALFLHADNLWLEWLVEFGLVGILVLATILIMAISALQKLTQSSDPLDHGIRVTGWYMLAATLVSQLFDFGLLMPANFIVLILTFAIVFHRASEQTSVQLTPKTSTAPSSKPFIGLGVYASKLQLTRIGSSGRNRIAIILASTILLSTFAASNRLRQDAIVESVVMAVEQPNLNVYPEPQILARNAEKLRLASANSPRIAVTLVGVEMALGRVADTLAENPVSLAEGLAIYQSTAPLARRLTPGFRKNDNASNSANEASIAPQVSNLGVEHYESALQSLGNALVTSPLSILARRYAIFLDFYHGNAQVSTAAIGQLRENYRNQPNSLLWLARVAAASGKHEAAADMLRETLSNSIFSTQYALNIISKYPQIPISRALPDSPVVFLRCAPWLIQNYGSANASPMAFDENLMTRAYEQVSKLEDKNVNDRVRQLSTMGDLAYTIGRYEQAFSDYNNALTMEPRNSTLMQKLIRRLTSQQAFQEALELARRNQQLSPNDPTIAATIASLEDRIRENQP